MGINFNESGHFRNYYTDKSISFERILLGGFIELKAP